MYTTTKLKAEKLVSALEYYLILRLSLVVGLSPNQYSHNFYNDLIKSYKEHEVLRADSSCEFEVSYLANVVRCLIAIIESPLINGRVISYTDSGITSRYKIAKDLFSNRGIAIEETTSNRVSPLPDLDLSIFDKYNLPRGHYKEVIRDVRRELGFRNITFKY